MCAYTFSYFHMYVLISYFILCIHTLYTTASGGRLSSSSSSSHRPSSSHVPPADPLTGHFKYVCALAEDRKNEAYPSAGQSTSTPVRIHTNMQYLYIPFMLCISCVYVYIVCMYMIACTPNNNNTYV